LTADKTPIATPETSHSEAAPAISDQRARCPLDDLAQHGDVARERIAEAGPAVAVAEEEVLRVLPELDVPRSVEAESVMDLGQQRLGGLLAGEPQGGIAVRELVEDQERDPEHAEDDDERPDEAAGGVEEHVPGSKSGGAADRRPLPASLDLADGDL